MEWIIFAILTAIEAFYFIFHVKMISRKYQESVKRLADDYQASIKLIREQYRDYMDEISDGVKPGQIKASNGTIYTLRNGNKN